MTFDEALRYFGTQARMARAVGVSRAAILKWTDGVPLLRQYQLERVTGGDLVADDQTLPTRTVERTECTTRETTRK